ncbi:MAG: GNAT family N-acetyltransferase [Lachnospiraceae bacterium]|nr:GNAT family N-acetyltransferase [Lachnospiraceae bacterium]
MTYYVSEAIVIRDLAETDAEIITREEIAQGWHQTIDKYLERLDHRNQGRCISLVAEYQGNVAGYINVYLTAAEGPFKNEGLPEIVDFGVLEKYRCRGIGTKLMDAAEKIAGEYADKVVLGVGLHAGYGRAQRMYVKRGYIPDGSGVWYANQPCEPYTDCANDDDLILYMSKVLR